VIPLELIAQAQFRLRGLVHRTPLVRSATLTEQLGVPVYLKLECLQKTGSFKPRGAFNKMLSLTASQRSAGIVAVSGGNHAAGVAYAARHLGIAATVVMPADTPANYVNATRGYGAHVALTPDISYAFAEVERLEAQGLARVPPFDDPLIAAGQGTIGLEILEDCPQATLVYVSIGGGGLISGVASALRGLKPSIRVIGVETRGADAMSQSLAAGHLVELPAITSIARTLGAPKPSELTFQTVRELVEGVIVVEDAEAVASLIFLLERTKYLTEPAASCCLAAAEREPRRFRKGDHVVLLLCGGNVSVEDLCTFRQRFGTRREAPTAAPL
jgi:threonine dehydratase